MNITINTFEDKELIGQLFEQIFPGFGEGGKSMKIIIDAFGGDNAPAAVLEGCAQAVRELGASLVLTGDEEKIRAVAKEKNIDLTGMEIAHAPTVIPVCEEPTQILKKYKDCSMAKGFQMLAAGEGDAFITAGSTGADIPCTFKGGNTLSNGNTLSGGEVSGAFRVRSIYESAER